MQRRNDGLERPLRDASASRRTFRPGIDAIIPIRSFRASSYDPFTSTTTKSTMPSSYRTERTAYSRPSYSGMSQSYHDYSTPTRSCSNRYGSTDQLYISPYMSSSGHGGSSTYRSNSSFTKSGSVGFSLPEASSRSYREYGSTTSYSNSSSSASRYRTAHGSTIGSLHQPKTNFDYRSKSPGYERDSRLCQVRYDRDCRSLSRSEKTPLSGSEDSDVEKAYQKLYNKYVKEDSDAENGNRKEGNVIKRPFTSQSEAEEGECSSEDDPAGIRSAFSEILGNARKRADPSLTTPVINDNSPDATPKCSPMMARKREPEAMAFSDQLPSAKETDKSDEKGGVGETLADSKAAPGQLQEQHPSFLLPTPTVKATTSTIDQLPQRGSLTTNLSEVVERKKSIAAPRNGNEVVSETPSRSVSPNIASVPGNQSGADIHILLNESSPTNSNTNATNSNLSSKNSPKRGSSPKTNLPSPTNKVNCDVTNTCGNTESPQVSPWSCTANLLTEIATSTTKYVESPDFAKSNDHHIHSKERSWTKGSDMNLDQKNRNYQNIDSPGLVNSLTEKQQELSQTSNELSTNITVPLVVLEKVPRSGSVSPSLSARKGIKESTPSHQSDPHKSECRKRRDPTRTLENLNGKLQTEEKKEGQNGATKQMLDSIKNQENGNGSDMTNKSLLPTVFVTEPSKPSTPMIKTTAQAVEESTDGDWTEAEDEADYESDYEYSVSQTFSLKGALPIGDLYPLSRSSSRCSPFISDYDSDASMPLFMLPSREAESRGRVDRLFAFPAPSFTCSITYDGQESWDEESLHSCAEYDEEYYGRLTRSSRPGSSALGAYLSPAAFSSDEDFDGTHFHEEVDVGCTLRLVDKAAMRADNYEEDSEYYDEEEYSDEECWDENGEYHEDGACDNDEEYEDEEKEVSDMVDEMHSTEESPDEKSTDSRCPLAFSQPAEVEDDINFEEMNDEFEVDMIIELAVPQLVKRPLEYPETHREVTYTKDLQLLIEDGKAETLSIDQQKSAKAVKKRIIKDGTSEKVAMSRTPQCVVPVEETAAVDESTALPDEEVYQLHPQHHEDDKSRHDVTVVPTYVRPQAETIKEESASRFSNQKAATDFARKAVIQPPKLHTAAVQQVETKTEQQTPAPETRTKETSEPEMSATIAKGPMTKNNEDGSRLYVKTPIMKGNEEGLQPKNVEDKSAVRKSALNMSLEEAKHKAAVNEEAAKQKARRFGTVSSLLNRFKEPALKEEPITYKRSCYLEQQEVERPKKQYNIVKPAINDNFDKQMEEIRTQMKSGSSHFQNSVKDLSKGITSTAEDIKKRAEEEKKKIIMDSVSGVFSKADEENARWKEKRDAETEKELAKIEAEKDRRKKVVVPQPKTEPEKPAEPKRIVRKIMKDKTSAVQQIKADDGLVLSTGKAAETSSKPAGASATNASTEPKSSRAVAPVALIDQDVSNSFSAPVTKPIGMERPKLPKTENVVNEDNYDLFEAATNVATRCRKSLVELRNQREQDTTTKAGMEKENETIISSARVGPKGDGAVATKIRNAIGNFTNVRKTDSPTLKTATEKSPKRYATRRKTQEIVNESAEPKVRKRKQTYKRSKFIRDPHDIDVLLGWDKENTFEKMDQMLSRAAKDLINGLPPKKRKRVPASKIWISDLTDIDKIYSISEIRDIIASANA